MTRYYAGMKILHSLLTIRNMLLLLLPNIAGFTVVIIIQTVDDAFHTRVSL